MVDHSAARVVVPAKKHSILAGELGPDGVRVVCIRPNAVPASLGVSHVTEAFGGMADRAGTTTDERLAGLASQGTLLGWLPTAEDVAEYAAFAAPDRARTVTGAIANLTAGSVVDELDQAAPDASDPDRSLGDIPVDSTSSARRSSARPHRRTDDAFVVQSRNACGPVVSTGDAASLPAASSPMSRWRNPEVTAAVVAIEASIERAWQDTCAQYEVVPGSDQEEVLAGAVVGDPSEHPWRVVDAALDVLRCSDCGAGLGAGPRTCPNCRYYDGFRFAGTEVDRPGAVVGNEHALRVATAVARTPHRYSARSQLGFELALPELLAGELPTTSQAQAARRLINMLTPEECDRASSMEEVASLVRDRRRHG